MPILKGALPLVSFLLTIPLTMKSQAEDIERTLSQTSIREIHSSNFGIDQSEIEDIRRAMKTAVGGGFIPGALLLVGNRDGVGLLETVGMQSPAGKTPVNKDTIFRIFSMTKPIISVAIMTMVEDGLIDLSDPLEKYIPEFANLQVINKETGSTQAAKSSITIENLLTHQSGIIQDIFSPDSDLGKRILENVSAEAWEMWLSHQTMLINEMRLTPVDPKARKFLEDEMEKYFFGEGSVAPQGYVPENK